MEHISIGMVNPIFPVHQLTANQQNQPTKQQKIVIKMNRCTTVAKVRNYKSQILKIPKVKQILNKDKFVYRQDIEKRLELIGSLKDQTFIDQQICGLQKLRKQLPFKNLTKNKTQRIILKKQLKRHRTNFKIPLTRSNVQSLNSLLIKHINNNQKYKNEETINLQYFQNIPFNINKLNFMDQIDKVKIKYKEKFPQLNDKVLKKNKLLLENVILNRNVKRELRLDQKIIQKQNENKFYEVKQIKKIRM